MCVCMLGHFSHVQLCVTLWATCSLSSSSVHGVLQAKILEWVAISSSRGSSWSKDWIPTSYVSCIGRQVLHWQAGFLLTGWIRWTQQRCYTMPHDFDDLQRLFLKQDLFILFWLHWVFLAAQGLSPVATRGGYSQTAVCRLLIAWFL